MLQNHSSFTSSLHQQMKETFYFPHDTNAHSDPKLVALLCDAWLQWLWMYRILVEIMHQQDDWMLTEKQLKQYLRMYATHDEHMFNTWWAYVEQMLNTFKTNDIFVFTDDWKIYSKRVLKNKQFRKDMLEKKSLAWIISWQNRRWKAETWTRVEHVLNTWWTQPQQGKERKGKERKEKDNINTIPIGIDDVTVVDDQEGEPPKVPKKKRWRTEEERVAVYDAIAELKLYHEQLGVAYIADEERIFVHHILFAKSFGEHCEKLKIERLWYAKNVLLASFRMKFLKWWVAAGPKAIYCRHEEIFNEAQKQKQERSSSWWWVATPPPLSSAQ